MNPEQKAAIAAAAAELDGICAALGWAGRDGDALFFLDALLIFADDPELTLLDAAHLAFGMD